MIPLACPVQTYAWGKLGSNSLVGQLKQSDAEAPIIEDQPYAELWMGTHPSGPACAKANQLLLSSILDAQPDMVGKVPDGYPTNDLPFLFKVLSVRLALSIQAHPDKALARLLHNSYPNVYRDPNHKPEMVIALTEFFCLAGFDSLVSISLRCKQFPEFEDLLSRGGFRFSDENDDNTELLRQLFRSCITSNQKDIEECAKAIVTRLSTKQALSEIEQLVLDLNSQFPNDVGIFAPIFLNYIRLNPGESFFIPANEPHAYLQGDCIECMALSDNVVRAGLTPKFKDVDTLCSMLTYRTGRPELLFPFAVNLCTKVYRPPAQICSEFEVELVSMDAHQTTELLQIPCASIAMVLSGENLKMTYLNPNPSFSLCRQECIAKTGSIVFIPASASIFCEALGSSCLIYRAHQNLG